MVDDRKLLLRHASEGGSDPDYAADLGRCSFAREADGALAALVPPPADPPGCAPDTVRGSYRTQVARVAKLSDADADREARAAAGSTARSSAAPTAARSARCTACSGSRSRPGRDVRAGRAGPVE